MFCQPRLLRTCEEFLKLAAVDPLCWPKLDEMRTLRVCVLQNIALDIALGLITRPGGILFFYSHTICDSAQAVPLGVFS